MDARLVPPAVVKKFEDSAMLAPREMVQLKTSPCRNRTYNTWMPTGIDCTRLGVERNRTQDMTRGSGIKQDHPELSSNS